MFSPITSGKLSIRYWSGPRPVLHASPSSSTLSVSISSWVAKRVLSRSRPKTGQSSMSGAEAASGPLAPEPSVLSEEEPPPLEEPPPPQAARTTAATSTVSPRRRTFRRIGFAPPLGGGLFRVTGEDGLDLAQAAGGDGRLDLARLQHRALEVADRRAEERAALDDGGAGAAAALQFLQVDDVVVLLGRELQDSGGLFGARKFFLDEHRQFPATDPGAAAGEHLHVVATDEAVVVAPAFLATAREG